MYLFDKSHTLIESPWKMGIIEDALPKAVADYLADNFLSKEFEHQPQYHAYQKVGAANYDDPVFKEFFLAQWNNRGKTNRFLNQVFGGQDHTESIIDSFSFNVHKPDPKCNIARDWHTDLPNKKFQAILYLGKSTDTVTFEMSSDPSKGAERSFTMQHNRLVFWNSTPETHHKFYFTPNQRCTVVMTGHYKDQVNSKYRGIPSELLK